MNNINIVVCTGKYPHLVVRMCGREKKGVEGGSSNEVLVEFGSIAVGNTSEKAIEIVNPTPVCCIHYIPLAWTSPVC